MTFETIEFNYIHGLWNKKMVAIAVRKGVITAEDYETIVGETYSA